MQINMLILNKSDASQWIEHIQIMIPIQRPAMYKPFNGMQEVKIVQHFLWKLRIESNI